MGKDSKIYRSADKGLALERVKLNYLKGLAAETDGILTKMDIPHNLTKAIRIAVDETNSSMTVFVDTDIVHLSDGEDIMRTLIGLGIEYSENYAVWTEPMVAGSLIGVTVLVDSEFANLKLMA